MNREDIERICEERGVDDLLLADGLDEAFIGFVERPTMGTVALYDKRKCVKVLAAKGMTEEEAEEFLDFNTYDAWLGDKTPCWADIIDGDDMTPRQESSQREGVGCRTATRCS